MTLRDDIALLIKGDAVDDGETRLKYSRDTSIFERTPQVVVFPKDADDVSAVVKFAHDEKNAGRKVSVTGRSAGSDMTGGDLTDSISMVFMKYMNHLVEVGDDYAITEPGVFYRDFEKATLEKTGKILPSYPASRGLAAMGGIVSNNSGGELTLRYGKTSRYVEELDVVLSDGSKATVRALSPDALAAKEQEDSLHGRIHPNLHTLIKEHGEEIKAARPNVTKNSAGYPLWDVIDETGTFDLNKLIAGSQGTLALVTKAKLRILKTKEHRAMLVVFLADFGILPEIVHRVLAFSPESFESYDDQTFKLAVRFIPQIIGHFGIVQMIKLGLAFIPEMFLVVTGGVPKLVVMAEFAEDTAEEAIEKAKQAAASLDGLACKTKIARSETQAAKYWTIRRESFSLLRKNLRGLHAASFIDDLVVHPDDYPRFIPELSAILQEHHLIYTIAGHIGDANFHIITLMNLADPAARREILELTPKVYKLVAKFRGSITGEHNDGIIRTPYLPIMYSAKMIELFARIKNIFDPLNILNPGKKVGGTIADIERSMIKGK